MSFEIHDFEGPNSKWQYLELVEVKFYDFYHFGKLRVSAFQFRRN